MTLMRYKNIFWQLLKKELSLYTKHTMIGYQINTLIWTMVCIITVAYVFPALGMAAGYGPFWVTGAVASCSIFEVYGTVAHFISDLEGNNIISYDLALPIPTWLLFVNKILAAAIKGMTLGIIILPIGKLMLWNSLSFEYFSAGKFIAMFISTNIFTATLGYFVAAHIRGMMQILHVWSRVLFPLWFLGCSQYPWEVLNQVSPKLATIVLFNPFTYLFEGIHASTLNPQGFLSFWMCLTITWLFTTFFGTIGYQKLRKKLDFV